MPMPQAVHHFPRRDEVNQLVKAREGALPIQWLKGGFALMVVRCFFSQRTHVTVFQVVKACSGVYAGSR